MNKNVISPEEGNELQRLLEDYSAATLRGAQILKTFGMESEEFREADKATGSIWVRIREIQGLSGKSWMV